MLRRVRRVRRERMLRRVRRVRRERMLRRVRRVRRERMLKRAMRNRSSRSNRISQRVTVTTSKRCLNTSQRRKLASISSKASSEDLRTLKRRVAKGYVTFKRKWLLAGMQSAVRPLAS